MPGNPQPLIFSAFLPARQTLLDRISNETNSVMSFDPAKLKLVTHEWPIRERARVTPEGLRQYREAHQYLGPGCLCPLFEPISNRPAFTESAIYVARVEPYKGEYVAGCAKNRCGYLVPLERIYTKIGVRLKDYCPRDASTPCPPHIFHDSETRQLDDSTPRSPQVLHDNEMRPVIRRPLKRTRAQADLTDLTLLVPERPLKRTYAQADLRNPPLPTRTHWPKINKLDCLDDPGLTEKEFLGLFVKCDACELVTAHLVFDKHRCVVRKQ